MCKIQAFLQWIDSLLGAEAYWKAVIPLCRPWQEALSSLRGDAIPTASGCRDSAGGGAGGKVVGSCLAGALVLGFAL